MNMVGAASGEQEFDMFVSRHATAYNADFPSLASTLAQQTFATRAVHDESRQSTPPIPPGFEGHESRRGTPAIPPGLSRPNGLPDLGDDSMSRPGSRPSSRASVKRTVSQILPVLPLRPATPATQRVTPSRQGSKDEIDVATHHETPTKPSRKATSSDLKIAMSAQDATPGAGADAANDDREGETVSVVKASADAGKHDVETTTKQPARSVAAVSETPVPSPMVAKSTPATTPAKGKATAPANDIASVPATSIAETPKRKHPGKIQIPAPVSKKEQAGSTTATPVDAGTPGRPNRALSQAATTSKLSESPMPSPAIKAPRTIRLTNTPKTEVPPPSNAAPVVTLPSHRFPSRQPSVSSINPPGTPSSEQVSMSDNISLTSTSLSRANSPPPASRVGSAPVRDKTKSQQKKDRQIRAKQLEEAELAKIKAAAEASKAAAQETEQEAVVSRMKKTKKEKTAKPKPIKSVNATADTTPTVSRPASPGPKATPEVAPKIDIPSPVIKEASKPATPTKVSPAAQAPPQALQSPYGPSPPATPTLTPAQLIAELKHARPELQKCIDTLFRVQSGHNFKTPLNVSPKDLASGVFRPDFKLKLTQDDVNDLLQGKVPAIHYGGASDDLNRIFDRGMITPSGADIRALTKELEDRVLELEKAHREMPEEFRFRPTKPQNELKFPTLDLQAMRLGFENSGRGHNVMEQMVQDGSTMKKGAFLVDEAGKYINEFVMPPATPPPSNHARTAQGFSAMQQEGSGGREKSVPGVEITERLLGEAKRFEQEREGALRKVVKKNRKVAGVP